MAPLRWFCTFERKATGSKGLKKWLRWNLVVFSDLEAEWVDYPKIDFPKCQIIFQIINSSNIPIFKLFLELNILQKSICKVKGYK